MKIPGKPAMKKQLRKKRTNSAKTAAKTSSEKTRSKKVKAKAKKSASTGDLVGLIGRSRTDVAKRKRGSEGNEESSTLPVADVPLGAGREYDIPGYDDPPKPLRHRKIHKRRKAPRVKKGEIVEDPEPTPPADIEKR